jgi:hypothetical protein
LYALPSKVKLNNANIPNAIILNPASYNGMILNNHTNLENAIIDDVNLIDYIRNSTSNIPIDIQNRQELTIRLKKKNMRFPS